MIEDSLDTRLAEPTVTAQILWALNRNGEPEIKNRLYSAAELRLTATTIPLHRILESSADAPLDNTVATIWKMRGEQPELAFAWLTDTIAENPEWWSEELRRAGDTASVVCFAIDLDQVATLFNTPLPALEA